MTGRTTIEWTAFPGFSPGVWNPVTGCTRVSAGCDNCYAFALHDKRYVSNLEAALHAAPPPESIGGPEGIRAERVAWARTQGVKMPFPKQYDLPFSRVQLLDDRLDIPLRTKKPTCYFVDSMADLFHEDVPDQFLAEVWGVMENQLAAQHRFLILTKRPERMRQWVTEREAYAGYVSEGTYTREPNIWLGTSVEDQRSANERIPHLLATPAAVRFLSCEPLLGPVSLHDWISAPGEALVTCPQCRNERWVGPGTCGMCGAPPPPSIDWVIVGGESGSRARPMDLAWARSLVEQCRAAGVAPFVKQLGSKPVEIERHAPIVEGEEDWTTHPLELRESHGRDMAEWPEDLRIREWPRG